MATKERNIKYRTLRGVRRSTSSTGGAAALLIGMRESDNLWEIIGAENTISERDAKITINRLIVANNLSHAPYTWLGNLSDDAIQDAFAKTVIS